MTVTLCKFLRLCIIETTFLTFLTWISHISTSKVPSRSRRIYHPIKNILTVSSLAAFLNNTKSIYFLNQFLSLIDVLNPWKTVKFIKLIQKNPHLYFHLLQKLLRCLTLHSRLHFVSFAITGFLIHFLLKIVNNSSFYQFVSLQINIINRTLISWNKLTDFPRVSISSVFLVLEALELIWFTNELLNSSISIGYYELSLALPFVSFIAILLNFDRTRLVRWLTWR